MQTNNIMFAGRFTHPAMQLSEFRRSCLVKTVLAALFSMIRPNLFQHHFRFILYISDNLIISSSLFT